MMPPAALPIYAGRAVGRQSLGEGFPLLESIAAVLR